MSIAGGAEGQELVVAEQPPEAEDSIAGRLTSWPDVTWEDFERASQLAQADLDRPAHRHRRRAVHRRS